MKLKNGDNVQKHAESENAATGRYRKLNNNAENPRRMA